MTSLPDNVVHCLWLFLKCVLGPQIFSFFLFESENKEMHRSGIGPATCPADDAILPRS